MKYKVILGVKFYDVEFLFTNDEEALLFANQLIRHMVDNDEVKRVNRVKLEIFDPSVEQSKKED